MRISVIVPVFNGERFLDEALRSVEAQETRPLETIVVDDGSTDGSAAIAHASGARCIRQERRGPAAARNAGVAAARGDAIAFLDADDIWLPSKLRRQAERLEGAPELGAVVSHVRVFVEPGCAPPAAMRRTWAGEELRGWLPSALLVRREAFLAVGPFEESLQNAEDVDWFARARSVGLPIALLPEVLVLRRLHDRNLTWAASMVPDVLAAIRRSVRRRAADGEARG